MENDNRVATSSQGMSALLPLNAAGTSLSELDFSEEQADWEDRWATPGDLSWRITEIPPELQEALDQGWFPPGADVLDIGCGSGECAAWLAQQGFTVLGVDFAHSAIAQARASHGESQQLQFAVLDICRDVPARRFQTLFDRGCLHIIPARDRPAYVRQISAAASPGAHFLLLHKTMAAFFEQTPSYRQTAERIRHEFQDTFDLIDMREIMIPRAAGPLPQPPVPGLAIRLVRKFPAETSLEGATTDRVDSEVVIGKRLATEMDSLDTPRPAVMHAGIPWRRPEEIESSIPARFEQIAASQPTAPAIIDGASTLTYADLNQAANRLAHELLAASATPVEAAGYLFGHGAAQIVAMLGILKTGGYCVPVDLTLPEALNREILADAQVRLIVTGDEHYKLAEALAPARACIVNLDHLRPGLPDTNPGVAISPDQLANLHYTSGSTGRPKGVMQNHRNTLHFMATVGAAWPIIPSDRIVHLVGCSFSAVVLPIWGALLNGAAVVPCDIRKVGIAGLHDCLREQRITTYFSVPTLYRRLAERWAYAEARLLDLRLVVLGGEPLLTADVESFRRTFMAGCRMLNIYAGAEMYYVCHFAPHEEAPFAGPTAPIGYAVEGKEVLLLDETRRRVAPGEVGEIAVRSRYLAPGYLNQPELTEAAFLPDPDGGDRRVYLTGDLGRLDASGCLVHMGRQNAMIKVRGQRVELGAVEHALRACQGVVDAAVALREGAEGEKALVAYIVRQPVSGLTARTLRAALRERLPEVMVPQYVVFLDAFPVTPGGKVDRQALPPPGKARLALDTPFVAPRTELEQQIADIWAEMLGVDMVGVEDNFFDLGGDSLTAMRMALAVEKAMGDRVLTGFFGEPTVAHLTRLMSGETATEAANQQPTTLRSSGSIVRQVGRFTPRKLVRHLTQTGPFWRGHALPYGLGVRLQRALVAQPWFQQRFYARQLESVRRWQIELGMPQDDQALIISLLANTWLEWRNRALTKPGVLERWVTMGGESGRLFEQPDSPCGIVTVVPHVGRIIAPLQRMIQLHGRETARVTNDPTIKFTRDKAAWSLQQTQSRTAQLWQAQQVLRRKGVVFIAGDGRQGNQTVDVSFRGRQRPFQIGAAELSIETDALFIPAFITFDATGRVQVEVTAPLTAQPGAKEQQIIELTRQYGALYAARWPQFYASVRWHLSAYHLNLPVA